jgi:hypothetical protein
MKLPFIDIDLLYNDGGLLYNDSAWLYTDDMFLVPISALYMQV